MSDEIMEEVKFLKEVMTKRFIKLIEHRKFCELDNEMVIDAVFDAVGRSIDLRDDSLQETIKKKCLELAELGMKEKSDV
jgi:hypothetical protein